MKNDSVSNQTIIAQNILIASDNGRISMWVDQSNYRGSWDIIWTCLVAIFLCTYTLLCLNVPSPNETPLMNIRRRLKWMTLAILGPEIVLTYAAGQWSRARHSVQAFHSSGFGQWSMRLAFFADMGGFVLQARYQDSDIQFPLNAKQLHWLVLYDHIDYPQITAEEIWDKSKQDRLARWITAFQIGYLIIQCIGRAAQGLAITTLELNALGIAVCSLMTACIWLHKPADVRTPHPLLCKSSIEKILDGRDWKTTPLDFVDENGPGWSMNVQPFMRMPVISPERPIQQIPNDRFPTDPYSIQEYCLCFATLVFTGIHVAGWNFAFPSPLEKILWRVASMILFGVTVTFWVFETIASWKRLERWTWLYLKIRDPESLSRFEQARAEKMSRPRESTTLPLVWEFWSIFPVAMLYGVSRIFLILEAFLELRDMEATAFVNVNWSLYIPHI